MDKKIYLWLQLIMDRCEYLNLGIILYLKKMLNNELNKLQNVNICKYVINKLNLDNNIKESLLIYLCSENIKIEVKELYKKIIKLNLKIVTIEDVHFPRKYINNNSKIICYITNKKLNLNNKNIYLYFNEYYTKFARNLLLYFAKIITKESNLFTEYNCNNKIEIIGKENMTLLESNYSNISYVILTKDSDVLDFKYELINSCIIIEARYEEEIVNIVNTLLDLSKQIYVVPSNIYQKNSYFSNYLIKQGADIILNKYDLMYILSNICS